METKNRIQRSKENWEIRQIRFQMYFDVIKAVAYIFVSIFVFFYLTNPEWTLQKKSIEDEINRERAKLTIDLMQLKKYEDIIIGLDVLKATYKSKDTAWIEPIDRRYRQLILKRIMDVEIDSAKEKDRRARAKELEEEKKAGKK